MCGTSCFDAAVGLMLAPGAAEKADAMVTHGAPPHTVHLALGGVHC